MISKRRRAQNWCWVVVLSATCASCSLRDRTCSESGNAGAPIDPDLMAFLSRARAAHHLADLREDTEPLAAAAALVAVVDGPIPGRDHARPAEAREVLADTQARIADLQSRNSEFDTALEHIESGLRLVPEVSYFRGHLFETRGLVEQRRSDYLTQRSEREAAQAAKIRALEAFEIAMQIQAEVIHKTPREPDASAAILEKGKPAGGTSTKTGPIKSSGARQ
jgi:hypothetical protein